ncbi:YczE/YyaS/YitT family protein [Clostridium sp. LP20]|uniref:YczE/YyaS/YitT family protein n=1 Tax=Clostridium sp. LP20 TaxID=3418665 RepID=UPI003EE45A50
MNKAINLTKRLVIFFIGMSIIQLGVALFLKTNIGSDPFTVFTQGLATFLNKTSLKKFSLVQLIAGKAEVTPGVANMIILIVLFTIIILVDKKRIQIGTLICVIGVGPIIDLGVKIVSYFPVESYNYLVRALLVLLGCFIIAVGFSIMSESKLGVAPNDIVPFIIQDKIKVEYRWIRIAVDGAFLLLGFISGGKVGVGTIIAMLSTGPFIQFCLPYGRKVVSFIVNTDENISEETIITA